MPQLRSIAYVSTASRLLTIADLESLLTTARDFNLHSGVTGVLLYSEGNFMQYFEGTKVAMEETWQRIRDSPQHRNIIELQDSPVAMRSFPAWQMGFTQPAQSEMLALSTAGWDRLRRGARGAVNKSPGLRLLEEFWSRVKK